MLDAGHDECGWMPEGDKFWVSNPEGLASRVIPLYYEHHSYASFTRSLNAYSFYKMSPSTWAHPLFHRDHKHLALQITRKATPAKVLQKEKKGGHQLRKQLDREQRALTAAQEEVVRLENELAEAQQQAKSEKHLLDNLERQAVEHVASLAQHGIEHYDLDSVKAGDFGLSENDLEPMEELLDESETDDTDTDIFAEMPMPSEDALVEMMHKNCKIMKYMCRTTETRDEELWKQSNCEATRAALEAYCNCLRDKRLKGYTDDRILAEFPEVREKLQAYEAEIHKGKKEIVRYTKKKQREKERLDRHRQQALNEQIQGVQPLAPPGDGLLVVKEGVRAAPAEDKCSIQ